MKKYTKKFIELANGEEMAYLEEGKGSKAILLIHGNMSSSIHWTPLIEKLEDDCKIYAVDMRGFGDTSYNNRFNHLDELAADVADFCQRKKISKCVVAGWSTGGGVAMSLAALHPELVKTLVLVDSMSYMGYPIFKKNAAGVPQVGQVYENKEAMAQDPVQVAPAVKCINEKNYAFMTYLWNLTIYTGKNHPSEEDNRVYMAETFKQRCLVDIDWSLCTYNISPLPGFYSMGNSLINKINVPVVCFWGEKDITVPELMTRQNEQGFKNFTLHVVKNSGHSPIIDDVENLAKGIKAIL